MHRWIVMWRTEDGVIVSARLSTTTRSHARRPGHDGAVFLARSIDAAVRMARRWIRGGN